MSVSSLPLVPKLSVTGQLADMPTRRLPTRGLDISWIGQLTH